MKITLDLQLSLDDYDRGSDVAPGGQQDLIEFYQRLIDMNAMQYLPARYGNAAANLIRLGICRPKERGE